MYNYIYDKTVPKLAASYHKNAVGPFYVSDQCIICGLPVEVAPIGIKWACDADCTECPNSCYIAKQPENDEELDSMIEAMWGSCVENIRYCGSDPKVIEKLINRKLGHLSDFKENRSFLSKLFRKIKNR